MAKRKYDKKTGAVNPRVVLYKPLSVDQLLSRYRPFNVRMNQRSLACVTYGLKKFIGSLVTPSKIPTKQELKAKRARRKMDYIVKMVKKMCAKPIRPKKNPYGMLVINHSKKAIKLHQVNMPDLQKMQGFDKGYMPPTAHPIIWYQSEYEMCQNFCGGKKKVS